MRLLLLLLLGCTVLAAVWFGTGTREDTFTPDRIVEEDSFEPLSDYVAPAEGGPDEASPTPFLSDPESPPSPREIATGLDDVHDLAFSVDGRHLLTAGYGDYSVRVWDTETGREVQGIRTHRRPGSIDVVSGVGRVVVADVYGFLRSYSWHPSGRLSWSRIHALEDSLGHEMAVSPNGRLLATALSGSTEHSELVLLDTTDLSVVHRTELADMFRRPAFSPSGRLVAAGSIENTFTVLDLAEGERKTYRVSGVNLSSDVASVSISPDDRLLATGHMDSSITIWDLELDRPLHNFYVPQASTWCVAFSPAGDVLATAQQDGTIRLWDPETAKGLAVLKRHTDSVTELRFHRDGRRLASAGRDGRVLLWETDGSVAPSSGIEPVATAETAPSMDGPPEQMTTAEILRLVDTVRGIEMIPEDDRRSLVEAADRLDSMSEEERASFVMALVVAASSQAMVGALQEAFVSSFDGAPAPGGAEETELVEWNLRLVPEAQPLVVGLQAMRRDDVELFKTIFSRRTAERFEAAGWEGQYELFRQRWQGVLGGVGSAHLHAAYLGTGDRGVIFVPEPTRNLSRAPVQYSVAIPEVPVVHERDGWKIDFPP